MVLRTGKEYQTYLAGQAGWQEKMPNHDADAILRPLLKIMCRQDMCLNTRNFHWMSLRKLEIMSKFRSNLQGGDAAEEEVGRGFCRGASGHV